MEFGNRPRLRVLLDHFALLEDDRESWRVAHPLPEVLFLVVCVTIGACDDFDEIVNGVRTICLFCGVFCPITMAFRVRAGFACS
jgi:hypothetical protein